MDAKIAVAIIALAGVLLKRFRLKMIQAWKKAANDLSFEVEISFHFNGIEYPLLVKNFGVPEGTIVFDFKETNLREENIPKGYFWSGLNSEMYKNYNRNVFIDMLEDWGWFGDESNKPDWYTGKYYQIKNNPIAKR